MTPKHAAVWRVGSGTPLAAERAQRQPSSGATYLRMLSIAWAL